MPSVPTLTRVVRAPDIASQMLANNPTQSPAPAAVGRHLLDLPPQILSEHRSWISSGHWQGMFDCAIWLRTPQGIQQPLQLLLRYQDSQSEKSVVVDRCAAGAYRTVLLNGSVMLSVMGRVRELSLRLINASPSMEALVDEWHLVPQQRR